MCLGIPMQITAIDGLVAHCTAKGVQREASLLLLMDQDIAVGEHVVVQLGHAIERISAEDAAIAWALYDEMLAAGADQPPEPAISKSPEIASGYPSGYPSGYQS